MGTTNGSWFTDTYYMKSIYKIISSEDELGQLIEHCKATGFVSLDFETNAFPVHSPDFLPTILGVTFQAGSSWIIPLAHKDSIFKGCWKKIFFRFCREVVLDPHLIKFCWNGLFEYRIFLKYGIRPRGRFFDAMLMKYLLNEERPSDLKSVVDYTMPDFSGYDLPNQPSEKASLQAKIDFWSNVDLEELSEYCGLDTDCTWRLGIHFHNKLITHNLYHLLRNFYSPLIRILSSTILDGVLIDREYLKYTYKAEKDNLDKIVKGLSNIPEVRDFSEAYQDEKVQAYIDSIQEEIDYEDLSDAQIRARELKISRVMAGEPTTKKEEKLFEPINFGSTLQLKALLFDSEYGLELPVLDLTEKGSPSTAEDTLLKLRDYDTSGFIDGLLEYRAKATVYSTFIQGIYIDHLTEEDRIHPSYLPHGTVTGRLSSRGPNMQNIPRVTTDNVIKPMFIAPKDHFFVEIDASQAELRLAAEMSKDPVMKEIFEKGQNIHVATAAKMFGMDYDHINKARKNDSHPDHLDAVRKHKAAKVLNFTIFYGAGPPTVGAFLTKSTGIKHTSQDATDFINLWFDAFPDTAKWIKRVKKTAQKQGFVRNPFGRKRRLPLLLDPRNKKINPGAWAQALRLTVNAPIQGGSSDITQWVSIQTYLAMLRGEISDYIKPISTIHDSNEYYIHKKDVHKVIQRVLTIGKELPDLEKYLGYRFKSIPMKFSAELGINWGRMHEYDSSLDYVDHYEKEWDLYNQEASPHLKYS